MPKARRDPKREERITTEIIVDAYGPEEQAMGWYHYLEGKLHSPFRARCISERAISLLNTDDEVEIVGMAPEDECQHEMFVKMRYERRTLAIPLSQIAPVTGTEKEVREAIEDWRYWIGQGYEL
jgi:hypothetical protein